LDRGEPLSEQLFGSLYNIGSKRAENLSYLSTYTGDLKKIRIRNARE